MSVKAPTILHESTGLTIRKNATNQFCVATLHYTADPHKRSREWKDEARAGMSEPKWQKEYEINYEALFGEKVFPEITTNKLTIVIREPWPEVSPDQTCWGGFDFGMRNPSSFHVYTLDDGVIYCIWELYEPCRNIPEFAQKLKDCPYYNQLRYIACDPDIIRTAKMVNKYGQPCTAGQLFLEQGITKFIAGNNDEQAWLALMRAAWAEQDAPTFRIYSCCPNLIREFESATFKNMTEQQMQTENYKENISDHNNHALDDCKYFMNSRPRHVERGVKMPNLIKRFLR